MATKQIRRDGTLWAETYADYKKNKPQWQSKSKISPVKKRKIYANQYIKPQAALDSQNNIKEKIRQIDEQIWALQAEKKQLKTRLNPFITEAYEAKPYVLYVLKLQNNCWYIGISKNVEKRFKTHKKGKGAMWTKRYKPIEIHETRVLETSLMSEAAVYEDELTLEYANNYGTHCVRGGGYCQTNPIWPDNLLGI